MFHMAAFRGAPGNSASYVAVAGVTDQSLSKSSNNRFIMPDNWRIIAAHVEADVLTAARINAPSLRNIAYPEIHPVNLTATVNTSPALAVYREYGPRVQASEEVGVDVSTGTLTVDTCQAAIWFQDKFDPAPLGPNITITATSTITTVVGAWVLGTLSFSQTLPAGVYAVIGFAGYGTNGLYARLVFPGNNTFRPGVVIGNTYDDYNIFPRWRSGDMGLFGTFVNTSQPQVEVMSTAAASTAHNFLVDLVKIR